MNGAATLTRSNDASSIRMHGGLLFASLCLLYVGLSLLTNTYVLTEEVYYASMRDQTTVEQIDRFLSMRGRLSLIGYALFPLLLAIKIGYTATCLAVGAVLLDRYDVSFKRLFHVALRCEGVFLLASVVQLGTALWIADIHTLDDFSTMFSFSLLDLFEPERLVSWLHIPLRGINLYELLYCAALGAVLAREWRQRFADTFSLVVASYGTGLVLWIAVLTFLALQLS